MMKQYLVLHTHAYGTTSYFLQSEKDLGMKWALNGSKKLAESWGIEGYDPDLDEYIDFIPVEEFRTIL